MNISHRASEFFSDATHGDALGDLFFNGLFLAVREFWDSPSITGVSYSFYNSPSNRQGIVQGIPFRLESSYDRQSFLDEVLKIYFAGICVILLPNPPLLRTSAPKMPDILLHGRNKYGGTCLPRQSCRHSKVCPALVFCP